MHKFFDPDSPMMQFFSLLFDLVFLNVLTLLFCLPLVTAGASITAMDYVLLHIIRGHDTHLVGKFVASFKKNLKRGTGIWLILAALAVLIGFDFVLLLSIHTSVSAILRIVLLALLVLLLAFSMLSFAHLSRYDIRIGEVMKNALFSLLGYFPYALLMAAAALLFWFIIVSFYKRMMIFAFLCGLTLPGYLAMQLCNRIFQKLEGTADKNETERN